MRELVRLDLLVLDAFALRRWLLLDAFALRGWLLLSPFALRRMTAPQAADLYVLISERKASP
ncbi:hypothetical protein ACFY5C_33325 [Streptomyces sp. NPDC012935]|uniref:hypothetical protein n=1 Tax=Streptomyces sp. NPDC012935 TaxID=3364857 RepID=UPI0036847511